MRIHLARICIAFILAGILLFGAVQAVEPLQVTVTATPSTISSGGASVQIFVKVMYGGSPLQGAKVSLQTDSESADVSYPSGVTDSSGAFPPATLSTTLTSGSIRVTAFAQKSTIDMYYEGQGYVDIPVQQVQFIQLVQVYQPPTPTPYQPPPYQPTPTPYQPLPYQPTPTPYQPPAPQQPQAAGNQQPVAVISVDNYAGNTGITINFDGQSSYDPDGSISSYAWNFGDGSTGSGYVAQHQYTMPGTFTASLVVTDDNGLPSNPATTQIIVQSTVQVQQQPVYQPLQQQEVYQPPPQPVKKPPIAPVPVSVINPAQPCDDGNKCTINDYYDCTSKCVAGRVLNCADTNPDTVDSCNPAIGCIHQSLADITALKMSHPQCGDYPNYVYIQNFEINKGSELQVPVMACGVKDLSKIVLNIDYNYNIHTGAEKSAYWNVLKFKNAEKGSLNENAIVESSNSHISDSQHASDRVTISFSSSPGTSGSGPLAMLTFDVIGDENNITFITPRGVTATDVWNNPIPFTTQGGTVIVKKPLQGDWYGNGMITTKNVLVAQQMASGKIPADLLLDMNNDNTVNAADVSILQKIASGERKPDYGKEVPANIPENVSKRLDAIEQKINSEAKKAGIAGKIEKIQRSFDVDLNTKPASAKKVVSSSSLGGGSSMLTGSSQLAQLPIDKLFPPLKMKNPSTACLPPMITAVKSGKNVYERAEKKEDMDSVAEDSVATIEGLNLGTCTEKDCGIYLEYPVGDVEFTKYYYEKTGQLADPSTRTTIAPNKLGQLKLLPYTGVWQDSWFDQGIVVKIPQIPRESEMVVSGSRYATLVVPIWPNGSTPMCLAGIHGDPLKGGGFQCTEYENQTVIRYPVWLYVDMAGIDEIHSNPDYSKSLRANPVLIGSTGIIPMYEGPEYYYSGPIIVSGGDLLITGENLGKERGNIKIVFSDPLIPSVQDSVFEELWRPDYLNKIPELPLTNITYWSDTEIRVTVPKVAGSYDVTPGLLYIQKKGASPNLWSWTAIEFSPKWVWKQISGKKFFKLDDDDRQRADVREVNHVLLVTHSPDCDCWAKFLGLCSGDWGFDTLFKQKPLPPNVKLLFFQFHTQEWNTNWERNIEIGFVVAAAYYYYPYEVLQVAVASLVAYIFDPGMGRYGVDVYGPTPSFSPEAPVNPDQPWNLHEWYVGQQVSSIPAEMAPVNPDAPRFVGTILRPTDPAINIEWHNSCMYLGNYYDEPVVYTTTFFVQAPEGVDVGE